MLKLKKLSALENHMRIYTTANSPGDRHRSPAFGLESSPESQGHGLLVDVSDVMSLSNFQRVAPSHILPLFERLDLTNDLTENFLQGSWLCWVFSM